MTILLSIISLHATVKGELKRRKSMKKISLLLCMGIMICSLNACGKEQAPTSTDVVEEATEETSEATEEQAVSEEVEETTAEETVMDYTENAIQVLLERKTSYSDIGEFYQVELYYPNDANLEIKSNDPNAIKFTCEDEDYILEIRTLEDSTFLNNWEYDKEVDSYAEYEMNGFSGYYTDKLSENSDKMEIYLQLDAVTSSTSRYLIIEIGDSYAGEYSSGKELFDNNETIKRILGSINYIGNIEKATLDAGLLVYEGKKYDTILEDPSTYLATDNPNMTWDCQVKDSYIYIKAKDSTDESIFFTTSIKRDSAADLEEWKENILKYSPDREIESKTIGSYDVMTYTSDESEGEVDCTHAVMKDGAFFNINSYASNIEMVEEYLAAMLDHMEIQFK